MNDYKSYALVVIILLILSIVTRSAVFVIFTIIFLFFLFIVANRDKGKINKLFSYIRLFLRIKNVNDEHHSIEIKDGIVINGNQVRGVLLIDDIPFDYRDISDETLRNKIVSFHKILDTVGEVEIIFKKLTIDKNKFLENLFLRAQNLRVIVDADPSNEKAKNELELVQSMIKKITEGETPFKYVIYFVINAKSEESALASLQLLKKGLESLGVKSRLASREEIIDILNEKLTLKAHAFPTQIPFLTVFSLPKSPKFEYLEDGIYLGRELGSNRSVFWNYGKLLNSHALIIGPTGSGKTETLISLGYKVNMFSKIPLVFFDTKSDIKLRLKKYGIKFKLLNPLIYGLGLLKIDERVDKESYILQLENIVSNSFDLDRYTSSILYKSIKEVFSRYSNPNWDLIRDEIEKLDITFQLKTFLLRVISEIKEYDQGDNGRYLVDTINSDSIYVIDLSLIKSEEIRRLILLSVLTKIYNRYNIADDKLKIALVVDEAWTILKDASEYSIIIDLIKRGRGFGIMLLMATQNIADLGKLSDVYLQNIGLLAFMNNGDKKFWQEVTRFVNISDKEIINELAFLGKGEALIRFITDPRPILVKLDTLMRDSL